MIKYFDLFSGVGGFRAGLERAGGFECVGHCEIDKHADKSYRAIFHLNESEVYYNDATKIDLATMPNFDLLNAGFPCQSFSIAGKRKGFDDARGTMFFEIARIAEHKRPKYMLLENVPGILSHEKGRTFTIILETLCKLGYCIEWFVLNSKNHGVPQSRRRVFFICYLDERCGGKILPFTGTNAQALIQLRGGSQGSRVYDTDGLACTLTSQSGGGGGRTGLYFVDLCKGNAQITQEARCITTRQDGGIKNRKGECSGVLEASAVINPQRETVRQKGRRIKNPEEPMYALTSCDRHGVLIKEATKIGYKQAEVGDSINLAFAGSNTRRGRVGKDIAHTLDTGSTQGVLDGGGRIRRLTPRECFRLQGFDEIQIDKLLAVTSDSQAYKQAGNSVTVNVIHAIGLRLRTMDDALYGEPL